MGKVATSNREKQGMSLILDMILLVKCNYTKILELQYLVV